MLDSKYEETMAKPTARESGTNNWRPTPVMKSDGRKTDNTQSMARNRGSAVLRQASTTDRALESPPLMWEWMFSISTVASSTSTPTARANPPRVMMLIVWPVIQRETRQQRAARRES